MAFAHASEHGQRDLLDLDRRGVRLAQPAPEHAPERRDRVHVRRQPELERVVERKSAHHEQRRVISRRAFREHRPEDGRRTCAEARAPGPRALLGAARDPRRAARPGARRSRPCRAASDALGSSRALHLLVARVADRPKRDRPRKLQVLGGAVRVGDEWRRVAGAAQREAAVLRIEHEVEERGVAPGLELAEQVVEPLHHLGGRARGPSRRHAARCEAGTSAQRHGSRGRTRRRSSSRAGRPEARRRRTSRRRAWPTPPAGSGPRGPRRAPPAASA